MPRSRTSSRRRSPSISALTPPPYNGRGNARMSKGDFDGAIADFSDAPVKIPTPSMAGAYHDQPWPRQERQERSRRRDPGFHQGHRDQSDAGRRVHRPRHRAPGPRQLRRRHQGLYRRASRSSPIPRAAYFNRGLAQASRRTTCPVGHPRLRRTRIELIDPTPSPTPGSSAATPRARGTTPTAPSPTSPRPSRSIRRTRSPIAAAASPARRRATSPMRSRTTPRRSISIRASPSPTSAALSSRCARATIPMAPSPIRHSPARPRSQEHAGLLLSRFRQAPARATSTARPPTSGFFCDAAPHGNLLRRQRAALSLAHRQAAGQLTPIR